MPFTIIADHDNKKIFFGPTEIIRSIPHSLNSEINFFLTELQTRYAASLIFLNYPEYFLEDSLFLKIS